MQCLVTGQNTEFATGKVAMYASGTWTPNEVKPITGEDFEWGFFNYPEVENGVNGLETMVIGSQSFAITSIAENPEAAFDLIEKLTRGEWDEKIAKETLGIPTDINNTEWPEELTDVRSYFENATGIFSKSAGIEDNPEIVPALKENLLNLYGGRLTAQEFVDNMEKAAK
ncbi:extracellular solute-binding protein [Jeotgalibaca sp. MA1X17-3]|uniref:extracellular solute-binding protein n=1 Tax=Jeotgalibaca sp. MA1X17-3 TaxID=2908211 RepID=UPI002104DE66|nr:extracellular solute-binding protein [Jeotgalibaca sp. MA1X17-3]